MNIKFDFNLWSLFDDHEKTKLRLTNYVVKKFFFDNFMNAFQKNQYLKKIYEKCLLRRIHASIFKKLKNKIIDQTLFKIKAIFLNCKFTFKKMKNYRASMKKHLFFIIKFFVNKKKFKFNLNVFRKMNMLSIWHFFVKLKKKNLIFESRIKKNFLTTSILLTNDSIFCRSSIRWITQRD